MIVSYETFYFCAISCNFLAITSDFIYLRLPFFFISLAEYLSIFSVFKKKEFSWSFLSFADFSFTAALTCNFLLLLTLALIFSSYPSPWVWLRCLFEIFINVVAYHYKIPSYNFSLLQFVSFLFLFSFVSRYFCFIFWFPL